MKVEISELKNLIETSLQQKYEAEEARLISDVILFGELSGKTSHGIVRLAKGKFSVLAQEPTSSPEIISKTKASSIIKGNGNPGMLVGALATQETIRLGKEFGIGIVGTNGSFGSSGCLSHYLEKIAKEDLIGIIMAQSPAHIAPHGGIKPMFGTNPLSFGIPSKPQPLIFDMATAAISFGAMMAAASKGEELAEGLAVDAQGNSTTDPAEAMKGAALSFDKSYKGTGLAMMVEILAGLWPEADYCNQHKENGWGNLFLAFSPGLLTDIGEFKHKTRELINTVRNSPSKNGAPIRIPGEKTFSTRDENLTKGEIEVDRKVIKEIEEYTKEAKRGN